MHPCALFEHFALYCRPAGWNWQRASMQERKKKSTSSTPWSVRWTIILRRMVPLSLLLGPGRFTSSQGQTFWSYPVLRIPYKWCAFIHSVKYNLLHLVISNGHKDCAVRNTYIPLYCFKPHLALRAYPPEGALKSSVSSAYRRIKLKGIRVPHPSFLPLCTSSDSSPQPHIALRSAYFTATSNVPTKRHSPRVNVLKGEAPCYSCVSIDPPKWKKFCKWCGRRKKPWKKSIQWAS